MVKVAACTLACLATVEACVSLDQYECWFFSVESHTGPFGTFSQSSYGCSGTIEVPAFFGDTSNWNSGSYGYTVDDRGITRSDGLTGTFGSSGDKFQIKWADGAKHTEDPMKICSRSADEPPHPGNAKLALPELAKLSTTRCVGSCCDDYCQCPGYEDHYCGYNGCDCGLSSNIIGCQYPYAPVECDAANFTISASKSADELPHPGNAKLALPELAQLSTTRCVGSCCDDYCQCPGYEDHYCGYNGCDCGPSSNIIGCQYPYAPVECDAVNFTISASKSADELPHPGNAKLALPEMAKLSTTRCSGSCCDDYCQCPGYEDHYCGSNGCDCGLSSNIIGCQYPYAPVECDAANFTISV